VRRRRPRLKTFADKSAWRSNRPARARAPGLRPIWAACSGHGTLPDGSTAAPVDADGWPTADAQTVLFDVRPIPAWAPPIDDPARFQPDWSGIYHLSFSGQADLIGYDSSGISIENQFTIRRQHHQRRCPCQTGRGRAEHDVHKHEAHSHQRSAHRITNLRLIRPGYAGDSTQVYTNEFLDSLALFSTIRFMSFTENQ